MPNRSNSCVDELMGCGAAVFAAALARHGVKVAFGQSIPSAFYLVAPRFGIGQAGYRTESSGAMMADGYARVAGQIGVVTAMHGPAAALLVPGLAEALKASVPVLALVQDVDRSVADRNAASEIDQIALFAGCAKWVRRIDHPGRIADYVDMAVTTATSGRPGPVVLLAPIELFENPAAAQRPRGANCGTYPLDRPVAGQQAVAAAAKLLIEAEAPVVIAGGGVHLSRACEALARLQEVACLPVATTTMGKGAVDESHPLSLGPMSYYLGRGSTSRRQRPLIEQADVVLLIGNRTNQNGTDSWRLYPPKARYIHIDIDGQEIGRNYEALRLAGDARATVDALRDAMERMGLGKRRAARSVLERRIAEGRAADRAETGSSDRLRPERLMAELDRRLTPETIVVADASYASVWAANNLTARKAGARFLSPRGLAGLGWGLPLAIGAKLAAPDRPVVAIAGDGAFAHAWSELETARRLGLALTVIVLNNQVLGYQRDHEQIVYGAHSAACDFAPVDHAAIARACGCEGMRIESTAAIGPALDHALKSPTPVLLDVVVDPAAYPPITGFDGKL
ncbi:MAG: acetolactate synthase catalytic subunit [Alphaproteobacteria bacterium]|nr:acetolactate synthase catalytic subunit [Alphaproteobacteria bacterium]